MTVRADLTTIPVRLGNTATPTNNDEAANKEYVDDQVSAGSGNKTTVNGTPSGNNPVNVNSGEDATNSPTPTGHVPVTFRSVVGTDDDQTIQTYASVNSDNRYDLAVGSSVRFERIINGLETELAGNVLPPLITIPAASRSVNGNNHEVFVLPSDVDAADEFSFEDKIIVRANGSNRIYIGDIRTVNGGDNSIDIRLFFRQGDDGDDIINEAALPVETLALDEEYTDADEYYIWELGDVRAAERVFTNGFPYTGISGTTVPTADGQVSVRTDSVVIWPRDVSGVDHTPTLDSLRRGNVIRVNAGGETFDKFIAGVISPGGSVEYWQFNTDDSQTVLDGQTATIRFDSIVTGINIKEDGTRVGNVSATEINFTGNVDVTGDNNLKTVNIPAGGGVEVVSSLPTSGAAGDAVILQPGDDDHPRGFYIYETQDDEGTDRLSWVWHNPSGGGIDGLIYAQTAAVAGYAANSIIVSSTGNAGGVSPHLSAASRATLELLQVGDIATFTVANDDNETVGIITSLGPITALGTRFSRSVGLTIDIDDIVNNRVASLVRSTNQLATQINDGDTTSVSVNNEGVLDVEVSEDALLANPGGTGLADLNTIRVRGVNYNVVGSGGGGGGGGLTTTRPESGGSFTNTGLLFSTGPTLTTGQAATNYGISGNPNNFWDATTNAGQVTVGAEVVVFDVTVVDTSTIRVSNVIVTGGDGSINTGGQQVFAGTRGESAQALTLTTLEWDTDRFEITDETDVTDVTFRLLGGSGGSGDTPAIRVSNGLPVRNSQITNSELYNLQRIDGALKAGKRVQFDTEGVEYVGGLSPVGVANHDLNFDTIHSLTGGGVSAYITDFGVDTGDFIQVEFPEGILTYQVTGDTTGGDIELGDPIAYQRYDGIQALVPTVTGTDEFPAAINNARFSKVFGVVPVTHSLKLGLFFGVKGADLTGQTVTDGTTTATDQTVEQYTTGLTTWYYFGALRISTAGALETDNTNGALGMWANNTDPFAAGTLTFNFEG